MKGVWQDHGRIKQESGVQNIKISSLWELKSLRIMTEMMGENDSEWIKKWKLPGMKAWVLDYVVWWPGVQRLGGGKKRGELLELVPRHIVSY